MLLIGRCILDDGNDKERNYTLYQNGLWVIFRNCLIPDIQVLCINGSWSEDISCSLVNTTTTVNNHTVSSEMVPNSSETIINSIVDYSRLAMHWIIQKNAKK